MKGEKYEFDMKQIPAANICQCLLEENEIGQIYHTKYNQLKIYILANPNPLEYEESAVLLIEQWRRLGN